MIVGSKKISRPLWPLPNTSTLFLQRRRLLVLNLLSDGYYIYYYYSIKLLQTDNVFFLFLIFLWDTLLKHYQTILHVFEGLYNIYSLLNTWINILNFKLDFLNIFFELNRPCGVHVLEFNMKLWANLCWTDIFDIID